MLAESAPMISSACLAISSRRTRGAPRAMMSVGRLPSVVTAATLAGVSSVDFFALSPPASITPPRRPLVVEALPDHRVEPRLVFGGFNGLACVEDVGLDVSAIGRVVRPGDPPGRHVPPAYGADAVAVVVHEGDGRVLEAQAVHELIQHLLDLLV